MAEKISVGIDVSKATLAVKIQGNGESELKLREYKNKEIGYKKLVKKIEEIQEKTGEANVHICMESTGIYSKRVRDYFLEKTKYKVSEVNPTQISAFSKSMMIRTKTDPVDAKVIATYCEKINPRATVRAQKHIELLQGYTRYLTSLKDEKTYHRGMLEAQLIPELAKKIEKNIKRVNKEIEKMEAQISVLIDSHSELKQDVSLLTSIPGVGKTTASIVLSELIVEGKTDKFTRKRQTAHAGLAPAKKESGTSIKGKERICKRGNAALRKALYMPTLSSLRCNPHISKHYKKLVSKGKPKMVALIAAMKKLLHIIVGILNSQKPYDPNWISKPYFVL